MTLSLRRLSLRCLPRPYLAAIAALFVAGCASDNGRNDDPLEGTNREIFSINSQIDSAIARPAAMFYNDAVPAAARDGIHNALGNLNAPVTFGNAVLQGESGIAGNTLVRFVINSSIGVGGVIDVAARNGLPRDKEDFGITLGVWGVGSGTYIVLPLLGPSNSRDLAGDVVDIFMDPLTYIKWNNSTLYSGFRAGLTAIDFRARNMDEVDQIERSSIDSYAMARSSYDQFREAKIRHGKVDGADLPDF